MSDIQHFNRFSLLLFTTNMLLVAHATLNYREYGLGRCPPIRVKMYALFIRLFFRGMLVYFSIILEKQKGSLVTAFKTWVCFFKLSLINSPFLEIKIRLALEKCDSSRPLHLSTHTCKGSSYSPPSANHKTK